MGTREVYEEKLRTGSVYHHDPTINPGLGTPRCPRCLSLIVPDSVYLLFFFFWFFTISFYLLRVYCSTLWYAFKLFDELSNRNLLIFGFHVDSEKW